MKRVKIIGVSNPKNLENYFASNMVDVAYVDKINTDVITLLLDNGIDVDNADDKKWISDLLSSALIECKEYSAKIIF